MSKVAAKNAAYVVKPACFTVKYEIGISSTPRIPGINLMATYGTLFST